MASPRVSLRTSPTPTATAGHSVRIPRNRISLRSGLLGVGRVEQAQAGVAPERTCRPVAEDIINRIDEDALHKHVHAGHLSTTTNAPTVTHESENTSLRSRSDRVSARTASESTDSDEQPMKKFNLCIVSGYVPDSDEVQLSDEHSDDSSSHLPGHPVHLQPFQDTSEPQVQFESSGLSHKPRHMSSAAHGLVAGGSESAPITQSAFERRDTASQYLFQPQTAAPIPKSPLAVRRQQRYASHIPRPQSTVNPLPGKRHDHDVASKSGLSSPPTTRAFVGISPRDPGSTSRSPTPASFPWTQSIVLPGSLSPSAIPSPHNGSAKSGRRGTGSTRAHPAEPSLASDSGSSASTSSQPLDRAKRGHGLESVTADEQFRQFVDALPYISLAEPAATSRGSPSPDIPMPQTVTARTSTSEAAPPLGEQSPASVTTDMPVAQWQGKLDRMPNGTTIWQAAYVFVPKQSNALPTPEDTIPAQTPPPPRLRPSRDTRQAQPAAHSSPSRPSSASPDPADIIHTLQRQLLQERAQSKAKTDELRASTALAEQLQRVRHELEARCAAAEGKLSTVRAQLELLTQTLRV